MSTPRPLSVEFSVSEPSCFGGMLIGSTFTIRQRNEIRSIVGPNTAVNTEKYEDLLNEGMKQLTFDELQHEQELLHGVSNETDLPETTTNGLLSSLQHYLNHAKSGTAYEMAEQRNKSYVCNQELQMAFLRATRFDPKEAARKIINFFRYKQGLFGDECLVRDITTQDLNNDDLRCLLEGSFQYPPFRDRSGRKIYLNFPGVRTKTAIRTELRTKFFVWANSVETMTDLSRGLVVVSYGVSQYRDHLSGSGFIEAYDLFNNGISVDVVGNHVCTDNRLDLLILNTLCTMMPHEHRVKTKIHFGSHTECQYLLSSYGITKGALPLTGPNSEIDMSHHQAWCQQMISQGQQEQNISAGGASALSQKKSVVSQIVRNDNDVLCLGRIVKGVGNDRLLSLARRYASAYEAGSASSRPTIVNRIIDEIHSHGGRFLKLDGASSTMRDSISSGDETANMWKELSPDERSIKVTQIFRNFRRRRSRWNPSTSQSSSSVATSSSGPSSALLSPIVVDSTKPEDVLFGQYVVNSPGNQRLRELVLGATEEYERCERGKKKEIVLRLIATIHQSGGRFLMARENQRWEVVSEEITRERISKHFRNLRRKW